MDELEQIREKKKAEMLKGKGAGDWPSEPTEVSDGNFDGFVKKFETVVVDCWAPWCGPCRMMTPVIDALAKEMKGKIAFGKLNTDQNQKVSMKYSIEAIPTLLVFKSGELTDRLVGARPKDDLMRKLQAYL